MSAARDDLAARAAKVAISSEIPVQVCSQWCGFSEEATREFVRRPGWRALLSRLSGRSEIELVSRWSSECCPLCGADLAWRCSSCGELIIAAQDRRCRKCGDVYEWPFARSRREWRGLLRLGDVRLWAWDGDLTEILVDGVVITDDPSGRMEGSVGKALKEAWGWEIEQESLLAAPGDAGAAWSTPAGPDTPVRWVVHTAAMSRDGRSSAGLVQQAATNALREAERRRLRTLAFSALGTGVAGLDMSACAQALGRAMLAHRASALEGPADGQQSSSLTDVVFVLLGAELRARFETPFLETLARAQRAGDDDAARYMNHT